MRKVDDGEKKGKKSVVVVATNIVASPLPERRQTGTPQLVPILDTIGQFYIIGDNFGYYCSIS